MVYFVTLHCFHGTYVAFNRVVSCHSLRSLCNVIVSRVSFVVLVLSNSALGVCMTGNAKHAMKDDDRADLLWQPEHASTTNTQGGDYLFFG